MDITRKPDRIALKSFFVKNAIPTASNFADMIEGAINQREDGIVKLAGEPLSIQADGDDTSQKKTINFYESFADPKPAWTLSLNPRTDPNNPATAKPGWSIGDADGNSRLCIDQGTGNVGVGTAGPSHKFHVVAADAVGLFESTGTQAFLRLSSNEGLNNRVEIANRPGGRLSLWTAGLGDVFNITKSGSVGVGTTAPRAKLEVQGGAIMPAAGNGSAAGIQFPSDPGSGTGDAAWIRFYPRSGENCTLELGVSDNVEDHIALMPSGNVGIGTVNPTERLEVDGRIKTGRLTVGPWPANPNEYQFVGVSTLNQGVANNYALLQGVNDGPGRTFVNSPADIRFRINNADQMIVANNGNVGVGTTSPSKKFEVNGEAKVSVLQLGEKFRMSGVGDAHGNDEWLRLFNRDNSGYSGGLAAGKLWCTSGALSGSDLQLKREVSPLQQAQDGIMKLRGVRFKWRDGPDQDSPAIGLIAQEVEEVFPEVVAMGPNGMKGINYAALIAPLIETAKQQQAEIAELRAEIKALKVN